MSENEKPKKKGRKLTLKQKKLAKAYIETGNKTKAAEIAGYKHPMQLGSETIKKLEKNEEFLTMMDRAGLTDVFILSGLREGVTATKKTYAVSEGEFSDEREDPDFNARHKFLETAAKLRGRLSKEHESSFSQNNLVIILGQDGKPAALDAEII